MKVTLSFFFLLPPGAGEGGGGEYRGIHHATPYYGDVDSGIFDFSHYA